MYKDFFASRYNEGEWVHLWGMFFSNSFLPTFSESGVNSSRNEFAPTIANFFHKESTPFWEDCVIPEREQEAKVVPHKYKNCLHTV